MTQKNGEEDEEDADTTTEMTHGGRTSWNQRPTREKVLRAGEQQGDGVFC